MARTQKAGKAGAGQSDAARRMATVGDASVGAIVAWAGGSAWRRILTMIVIALLLTAPGVTALGPTDRDEGRYAQAAKQMHETGDYIDIRFQEEPRHKKPIGIYWAQAASTALFGGAEAPIWAYRLPSLLGAVLASLLTIWAMRPLIGERAAFLAGAMTAGLLIVSYEAKIAKTDALLLAALVAAQGALARLWFGFKDDPKEHGRNVFYFWTALAAGVLIKGPIILIPVLGALAWVTITFSAPRGRVVEAWGRIGWGWGLVWLLLLTAPWFIAIGVKTDGAFFGASVGDDMLGKVAAGQQAHWGPPGYYLLTFWGTFWPWTALAPLAVIWTWGWRRAPETAFLLGWIIPTWILFEIVSTKLPHYVMPVYPAICGLIAAAVLDGSAKPRGLAFWVGAALWAIPAAVLPLAFALGPPLMGGELSIGAILASSAALIALVAAWRWLVAGVWIGFLRAAAVGAGFLYLSAFQFSFPALSPIWTSDRMAALTAPLQACVARQGETPRIGAVGYHEPSLVFLTGTDIALLSAGGAATFLKDEPGGMVWVDRRRRAAFETALETVKLPVAPLAETSGFNYNRGKVAEMTLYAWAEDPILALCQR